MNTDDRQVDVWGKRIEAVIQLLYYTINSFYGIRTRFDIFFGSRTGCFRLLSLAASLELDTVISLTLRFHLLVE